MTIRNRVSKYFPLYALQINTFILFYHKIFMTVRISSASYMHNLLLDVLEDFCLIHCYPTI